MYDHLRVNTFALKRNRKCGLLGFTGLVPHWYICITVCVVVLVFAVTSKGQSSSDELCYFISIFTCTYYSIINSVVK